MNYEQNLIPIFVMRTCKQRPQSIYQYFSYIPELIECFDDFEGENTSMLNMKKALSIAIKNKSSAVFMEDDIILCQNFKVRLLAEIDKKPNDLIQFFSMRKDNLTIGSRYISGSKYLMNQCFYCPLHIIEKIYDCFDDFEAQRKDNRIGGTDSWVQFALKKHKLKYWNVVPNLVQHIIGQSAIDKRRSSKRLSITFNYEQDI